MLNLDVPSDDDHALRFREQILTSPRYRTALEHTDVAGMSLVVSGKPEAWMEASRAVAAASGRVVGFHDARGTVRGERLEGIPILRGGEIDASDADGVVFAGPPTKDWFSSCPPYLQSCLWHIAPRDWQHRGYATQTLWRSNQASLVAAYRALEDDSSRATLASLVRARLEGDTGYGRIASFPEYEHPSVRAEPGDIVLDGGAFNGDTAIAFSRQVGDAGRVIALEPSDENQSNMMRRCAAAGLTNVTPLPLGLWSEPGILQFEDGKGASSRIVSSGGTKISVTTVDAVVQEHALPSVDLLKLDVEGAEAEALRGAEKTLRRFRPKLQISMYHHADDLWSLFDSLRARLRDYRFYLGHHSFYHMETDLYARPV